MKGAGLPVNPTEAYNKYKTKVGKYWSAVIEIDLQMRPKDPDDPEGEQVLRRPQAWKEAHSALKEKEQQQADNIALYHTYAMGFLRCRSRRSSSSGTLVTTLPR